MSMKENRDVAFRVTRKEKFKLGLEQYASELSILCALLLICLVTACLSPYFLQLQNIKNILSYVSIAGVMSAGLTVVMLMGCMDLSQYAVMAALGMYLAKMVKGGVPTPVALIVVLILGALVGCFNAFAVTKMHIVPMIATIGTQLIARAIAYLSTNGNYLMVDTPFFYTIGYTEIFGLPYLVWILIIVNVALAFVLSRTAFGRKVYAVGGNPQACALSGINVDRMRLAGYIFSGVSSAIAAIICTAQVSAAYPTAGNGQEMDCVAAVYLGGLSVGGGKGTIVGTFIGVVIIAVLLNAMTLLSINAYYQMLFKGLVLLLAVYIDQARQMRKPKKKKS